MLTFRKVSLVSVLLFFALTLFVRHRRRINIVIPADQCSYDTLDNLKENDLYPPKNAPYWVDVRHLSGAELWQTAHDKLELNGFVFLRGVVDKDMASELRQHIVDKYGRKPILKPYLHDPQGRFDQNLDLDDDTVRKTLNTAVTKLKPLYSKLVGRDGHMTDLSCMYTCNSSMQQIHVDVSTLTDRENLYPMGDCGTMYSTYIALQPTPANLGATNLIPKTQFRGHEIEWLDADNRTQITRYDEQLRYKFLSSQFKGPIKPVEVLSATLGVGDALVYNNGLLHGAGKNSMSLARMMFYYSFQSRSPMPVVGAAANMKKEYYTVKYKRVSDALMLHCQGNSNLEQRKDVPGLLYRLKEGFKLVVYQGKYALRDFPLVRVKDHSN